jgi:hypothetical protein
MGKPVPVPVEVEPVGGESPQPGEPTGDDGVVVGRPEVGNGQGRALPLPQGKMMERGIREEKREGDNTPAHATGPRGGFQKKKRDEACDEPDDGLDEEGGEG